MNNTLKWLLAGGAALAGLLLIGAMMLNPMWVGQSITSFGHGTMMYGGHHSTFGVWPSYGALIGGIVLFLALIGGVFLAIRSKPGTDPASMVRSEPLETCPDCAAHLEPNWKYCPFCGFDFS